MHATFYTAQVTRVTIDRMGYISDLELFLYTHISKWCLHSGPF